jgi:hypothetical protein
VQDNINFAIEYTECKLDRVQYILERLFFQKGISYVDSIERMEESANDLLEIEESQWREFVQSVDRMHEDSKQWITRYCTT